MFPSYFETREALLSGKTTCRKLVAHYLQRGHDHAAQNIFLELFQESATERARVLDEKLAQGKPPGRLFGFVIALKDNIVFRGHKCSASSRILEGFVSPYSATAVERLLNEDAIIIGRTNCDEFAMGSSNENSAFGPVLHPPGTQKVPGGSSGGSAAAVATGSCLGALGSDTGGSIRQPASFCGVVGLKPGYGRISRYGLIAYGSSFDQIGPLTHNVSDAALLLEVMAGADDYDSTASAKKVSGSHRCNKSLPRPSFPRQGNKRKNPGPD
jgi:aspartyl-tRNA(Asn)/glutamyl-tRNA(Gln) amidotransferase subunit A